MAKQEDDFGFTFVDQTEYEAYEKQLKEQVAQRSTVLSQTQDKLDKIITLIDPFLKNLSAEPTKIYIKWQNRAAKVKEFRDKIQAILDE